MKILSDFDGVMTDQTEEAQHEETLFRNRLVELSDGPADAVDALLVRARAELVARPTKHGWWSRDRVSAYADEDMFIRVIGMAVCLDHWAERGEHGADGLRESLRRADVPNFVSVSDWAYATMVQHTRSGELEPMDPVVGEVLTGLLEAGHDIVVVSNSATDRVVALLETLGLEPKRHDEAPEARFRVRGDARKFELGEVPDGFDLDGFRFDVSRPAYLKILDEECPDMVIGDVFSLDLALPLYLTRSRSERFGGMRLLLRTRHYTPDWSRAIFARNDEAHASLGLLEEFSALPSFVTG